MNKKAQMSRSIWIIAAMGIIIIVTIFILLGVNKSSGKLFAGIGERIDDLGDCDGDNAANLYDKCPCTETGISEHDDLTGCPASFDEEKQKKDKKECTSQKCDQLQGNAPAGQPTAQTR